MKNMSYDQNIDALGRAGEIIVSNHYTDLGHKVKPSLDKFDRVKDLVVDGINVEVKTQQPYVKMNALTFRPNQLPKCSKVDRLNFVTATAQISPNYKWNNCIFEVSSNFITIPYVTSYGVSMVAIPIEQEAVKFIRKLTVEEASEIARYTQSNYKNGKKKL